MKNPLVRLVWVYWRWNVTNENGPIEEFGRVWYVTNDFDDVVMISAVQLATSLADGKGGDVRVSEARKYKVDLMRNTCEVSDCVQTLQWKLAEIQKLVQQWDDQVKSAHNVCHAIAVAIELESKV